MATEYGAILTDEDLDAEMKKRRAGLVFPLHIFPDPIKPFINTMLSDLEGERGFVGLTVLQAASTAIGSGLRVQTGNWETCVSIWGCAVGISSSGKSMTQGMILKPLFTRQNEYDIRFREVLKQEEYIEREKGTPPPVAKVFIYSDITFEALTRDILGHNFKGVTSYHDELLKWLDDMKRYSKGGNSEQSFYTASWSPAKSFTMRRAGGKMLFIDKNHLVISVIGTTQPGLVYKFYEDMRLESGYVFRLLWAFAESDKVISPRLGYKMPAEVYQSYANMLERLFLGFPMERDTDEPLIWELTKEAVRTFQDWQDRVTKETNTLEGEDRNVKGGILGKIKEYVLRFSGILKAMYLAADGDSFSGVHQIEAHYVGMAIEAATYFLASGWEAYTQARNKIIIEPEAIRFHAECRAHQFNFAEVGRANAITKQAIGAKWKRFAEKYPHLFNKS